MIFFQFRCIAHEIFWLGLSWFRILGPPLDEAPTSPPVLISGAGLGGAMDLAEGRTTSPVGRHCLTASRWIRIWRSTLLPHPVHDEERRGSSWCRRRRKATATALAGGGPLYLYLDTGGGRMRWVVGVDADPMRADGERRARGGWEREEKGSSRFRSAWGPLTQARTTLDNIWMLGLLFY
jgi:hypothetical protein